MIRIAIVLLFAASSLYGRQRAAGFCEQGGHVVVTNTVNSTTRVQRSFPSCTVTVYATGTQNLSTIFADNAGTAKANPFAADSNGYFFFYADDGRYDVRLSGGGIPAPFTLGDILLDDTAAAGTLPTISGALRYVRTNANSSSAAYELATEPTYLTGSYNWSQTPGGSVAIGANTITLTPCPLGVSGASTNHRLYISGGVGTAESVLISGGTCTSGAATGTVIVTAAVTHSGSWTIASATAGFKEAAEVAIAAGSYRNLVCPAGTYTFYDQFYPSSISNLRLSGYGCTINLSANNQNWSAFFLSGGGQATSTTVTSNVNYPNRDRTLAQSLVVASASGLSVGDTVLLVGTENTRTFTQINRISGIAGTTITMQDGIRVPIQTTDGSSVQKINLSSGLMIEGFTFDGTSAVGATGTYFAISAAYLHEPIFRDLKFNNFSIPGGTLNSGGILTNYTYRSSYSGFKAYNVGDGGGAAFYHFNETDGSYVDMNCDKCNFGWEPVQGVGHKFTNISCSGCPGRGVKMQSIGWFSGSNVKVNNSYTGVLAMGGSYNGTVTGVEASWNTNGGGVGCSGEDVRNITFMNVIAIGNAVAGPGPDFGDGATDVNCSILGVRSLTNGQFGSTSSTFSFAHSPRAFVYNDAAQSIPNGASTNTAVTFNTELYDWGGTHSTASDTSRIIFTVAGVYQVTGKVCLETNSTGDVRQAILRVNGTTNWEANNVEPVAGTITCIPVSSNVQASANDYVELLVNQDSGSPLNTQASLQYTKLSIAKIL